MAGLRLWLSSRKILGDSVNKDYKFQSMDY